MGFKYVRVKDKRTGHQYDVLEQLVDKKNHELVDQRRFPPTSRPRPPKHHVGKPPTQTSSDQPETTD